MRARLCGFIALAALASCMTPVYGPIGAAKSPYGYRDTRNTDGSYTILVVAPTPVLAHEYWDRRAAELCGGTDFRKNIFRAQIPVVSVSGYATNPYNPAYGGAYTQDAYGNLILEGYLHCADTTEDSAPPSDVANDETPADPAPTDTP